MSANRGFGWIMIHHTVKGYIAIKKNEVDLYLGKWKDKPMYLQ